MDIAPHLYLCVRVTKVGQAWKANIKLDGYRLEGSQPHSILQNLMDAGGEIIDIKYAAHFAFIITEAHIFWMRFPKADEHRFEMLP